MKRYGLKQVAEKKYIQLIDSVRKYGSQNSRIQLFQHFFGLMDEEDETVDVNF